MSVVSERAATLASSAVSMRVEDGIAIVTLDLPGESVNTLRRSVREEFSALFDRVEQDASIRAVVLISGKPENFIAGADIDEFLALHSADDAAAMSRDGQALIGRLEVLRAPVVAAIHGACLGGGLETALACAYRICTDHPKTVLALPEVQLGLIPGAGGTQRLPRTVALPDALDMILSGRNVRAKKALQIGLVDEMVHPAILSEVAIDRARQLADGRIKRTRVHKPSPLGARLMGSAPLRPVVFHRARTGVLERTHGH